MADILNTNPNTILENFQSAYYDQIGKRMQIGSEEYILSSVFTYVLSLYAGLVNQSYKNQNIDTASGEFLDSIAARYNLSRMPEVYSNPWFEGRFYFGDSQYRGRSFDVGEIRITVGEHEYLNSNAIASATDSIPVRFVCTEAHKDYLSKSELIAELAKVEDTNGEKIFNAAYLKSYRLSEMQGISNELSDDELRTYIKENRQLYVPGVAGSFEALAKASSDDITDARVRVQSDAGFRAGYVDLYCKPYYYQSHSDYAAMIRMIDIPNVATVIADKNLATIGQTVTVNSATAISDVRSYRFFVPKAYADDAEYISLYTYKFNAVRGYMNNLVLKINEPFIPSMVVPYMTKSLSELSDDPADFGLSPDDLGYKKFDKYKDLPVIGLESISSYTKRDSDPTSFVYIGVSKVDFTFI